MPWRNRAKKRRRQKEMKRIDDLINGREREKEVKAAAKSHRLIFSAHALPVFPALSDDSSLF